MENQGLYVKNVFDISEKCQYLVCNTEQEILDQKIKMKKLIKIYFSKKQSMLKILNVTGDRKNCKLSFGV